MGERSQFEGQAQLVVGKWSTMLRSILRDLRIQSARRNVINNVRHEATKEGRSHHSWGSLSSRKRWGTWSSDSIGNPIILSVSFVNGRAINRKPENRA